MAAGLCLPRVRAAAGGHDNAAQAQATAAGCSARAPRQGGLRDTLLGGSWGIEQGNVSWNGLEGLTQVAAAGAGEGMRQEGDDSLVSRLCLAPCLQYART